MYRVSVGRSEGTNARKAALSMFDPQDGVA